MIKKLEVRLVSVGNCIGSVEIFLRFLISLTRTTRLISGKWEMAISKWSQVPCLPTGVIMRTLLSGAESQLLSVTIAAGKQIFWNIGSGSYSTADVFYASC